MNKKKIALSLALLMVVTNLFNLMPVSAFAYSDTDSTAANAAVTEAADADSNFGLKPETVQNLKDNWTDVKISENEIELGEYKGQDTHVVVPGEIEGKQVYITRFPGSRSDGSAQLTPEQAKIESVVLKEVNGKKVKTKKFADDSSRISFGVDITIPGDKLSYVDVSGFDISSFTVMSSMFRNRYNLKQIDGLDTWDTSKITDMGYMFFGTPMADAAQLKNWDVSNVTRTAGMFGKTHISDLEFLRNWNVSKVTDMSTMFTNCKKLGSLEPLSNWGDKLNATDNTYGMYGMFMGANVTDVSPLKDWDLSKVTQLWYMFKDTPLEYADLSGWHLNPNANIKGMFMSNTQKPILVITTDAKLKAYDFAADNRVGAHPSFEVDGKPSGNPNGTFTLDKVTDTTVNDMIQAEMNQLEKPTKPGYDFVKWEVVGNPSNPLEALNATYVAVFAPHVYTIHFDTTGGSAIADQNVAFDQLATQPTAPTKTGHIFQNWVVAAPEALKGQIWEFGSSKMPDADVTLTAQWSDHATVEIIFDDEHSTSGSYLIGEKIPQPQAVTKPGYTLEGWYTDATFTTKWDFNTDVVPEHDMTLVAKWVLNADIVNHAPTITAQDVVLTVGDSFHPLAGVTAYDQEDGNITLTETNITANNVNTKVAGTYHVTFTVTDQNGATTQKTITVTVKSPAATPNTGDMASLSLMGSMFATSAGALAVLLNKKSKKK